jgi:gamma-glutamyltranspeptidase / glutathione hydrolase
MRMPRFPHAAVASPHYLASAVGLGVLYEGGNAADAAVAMNLALAVVYPHMCGLGGDLIAMVWEDGDLVGLNSTGKLPARAPVVDKVDKRGILSATVPGGVAGLIALNERFGSEPISRLVEPAIRYASEGVPRSPEFARLTPAFRPLLERDAEAARIFLSDDPLVQTDLARTLEDLDSFYEAVGAAAPAPFTRDDFTSHKVDWVEPLRTEWCGLEVCEMPPNSRGHLALKALERLEPLDGLTPEDAEWHQRIIRAFDPADAIGGDTIYLCARDENGMSVSLNQSLSAAYGSGVVIPGTGVLLHNRAEYFSPHTYIGGTKPMHTLAPAMALQDGEPRLIFGSMGGPAQIEFHLQLLTRIFVAKQDVDSAIAAPRWRHMAGQLLAESGLPDLGASPMPDPHSAGHAHAILVEPTHLVAGADPRSDGSALGL